MRKKALALALACLVSVVLLSYGAATAKDKKMVKDPGTGKMVEAPRYGGRITVAMVRGLETFDPYRYMGDSNGIESFCFENGREHR